MPKGRFLGWGICSGAQCQPKALCFSGNPACKASKQVSGVKGSAGDRQLVWGEESWGEKAFFSPWLEVLTAAISPMSWSLGGTRSSVESKRLQILNKNSSIQVLWLT